MLALVASAGAQLAPADSMSRWVDSIFAPYASKRAPGCAVGITRDGVLTFAKGYGMADLEHNTPITTETRFYIASISKQFTAMSIVLLAQEHRLSLDDSIQKWVTEVPSFGATIALRHLLHRTSELRDYFTRLRGTAGRARLLAGPVLAPSVVQKPGFLRAGSLGSPSSRYRSRSAGVRQIAATLPRNASSNRSASHRVRDVTGGHRQSRQGYVPNGTKFKISQPEFDVVGDGRAYRRSKTSRNGMRISARPAGRSDRVAQEPGQLNDGGRFKRSRSPSAIPRDQDLFTRRLVRRVSNTLLRFPKGLSVVTLCNTPASHDARRTGRQRARRPLGSHDGGDHRSVGGLWSSGAARPPVPWRAAPERRLARVAGATTATSWISVSHSRPAKGCWSCSGHTPRTFDSWRSRTTYARIVIRCCCGWFATRAAR
jgi:hypothetical protein